MKILRTMPRGGTTTINTPSRSIVFTYSSPVGSGHKLLHELGDATPTLVARDLDGNIVNNVYIEAVTDDLYYDDIDIAELKFTTGSTFTGTLTLSTP